MNKSKKRDQVDTKICVGCGKKIPKLRLKALPNAQFCVKCQREYENEYPLDDSVYLAEPDAAELQDIISPDD